MFLYCTLNDKGVCWFHSVCGLNIMLNICRFQFQFYNIVVHLSIVTIGHVVTVEMAPFRYHALYLPKNQWISLLKLLV